MNENVQSNSNRPEGWTEDMRPLADPLTKTPVLEVIDTSGQPVVTSPEKQQVDEGAEYWQKKFEEVKAQNEKDAPYKQIMEHLKTNGDLVNVLEKHIAGEFVEARQAQQTIFDGEEEDEYGNPIPKESQTESTQDAKPAEETTEQARERGRMEAAAEIQLKTFLDNLMSVGGVPSHVTDKFVETINNPSGFNIADLYAAFENKETREKQISESQPITEDKKTPMGVPVSSAGGSTDKPTGDKFLETPDSDGQNYSSNPNVI